MKRLFVFYAMRVLLPIRDRHGLGAYTLRRWRRNCYFTLIDAAALAVAWYVWPYVYTPVVMLAVLYALHARMSKASVIALNVAFGFALVVTLWSFIPSSEPLHYPHDTGIYTPPAHVAPPVEHHDARPSAAMPWSNGLQVMRATLSGEIAYVIAIICILGCGVVYILGGEVDGLFMRVAGILVVISIIAGSASFMSSVLSVP